MSKKGLLIFINCFAVLLAMLPFQNCGSMSSAPGSAQQGANDQNGGDSDDETPADYAVYTGCASPSASYSRKVYIDPVNGTDSGTGFPLAPYKTLSHALQTKKIVPGDHVVLLAGNHGTVNVNRTTNPELFESNKWIWLDGKTGASVNRLHLQEMNGWLITNLEATSSATDLISLRSSSQIIIADSEFYTTKNSNSWSASDWINTAASGVNSDDSECVSLLRNNIYNVRFGISISSRTKNFPGNHVNALILENEIRNFSADGVKANASHIRLVDNRILDSYVSNTSGDSNQDDAIQITALNGDTFENIEIQGTYIQETTSATRSYKSPLNGIYMNDGLAYRMKLQKNIVISSNYYGIALYGAQSTLIEYNTIVHTDGMTPTGITVLRAKDNTMPQGVSVRNNLALIFSLESTVANLNNHPLTSMTDTFVQYDTANMLFDLHLKPTSPLYGTGAGAYTIH